MRTPQPLPAPLRSGPFRTRDALRLGVDSARLAAADLHHPFHGVYSPEAARTIQEACRAFLLRAPEGSCFSHETAAALLGIPLPGPADIHRLHVAVEFPRTPPRGRGVVGHSLGRVRGEEFESFPICSPAQVWCQLAGVLDRRDLVAAGDHLLGARKRTALVDHAALARESADSVGTKGARARAWALSRLRTGVDSRPETLLRLLIEEHGYGDAEVNRPVPVQGGRLILHPDLTLPSLRIALEYEGDQHRTEQRQWHADIERRDLLESAGWRVVRVTARDLFHDPDAFLTRLAAVRDSARMPLMTPR
jgi:very-short-patch-repair endonuclease